MPTFAVDWDGTCVEQKWPAQGKWLPGAVEALQTFDRLGTVIIHSVRIAPVKPFTENKGIPKPGEERPIHPHRVRKEINYIQRMLDKAGLGHMEIWQRPYKPPAAIYIDDRALRFEGDWEKTVDDALRLIQPQIGGK